MIVACDIETSCNVAGCTGGCEHAVHHKHNKIDIIGVYDGENYELFTEVAEFDAYKRNRNWQFVFHNGKFDYKTLREKGSTISLDDYVGDTQLLGACVYNKVPDHYLRQYNEKRKELNESLPAGQRHRVGTPLSLKTMAPYYLGVKPFWENTETHNDSAYNRTDCIHTYNLYQELLVLVDTDGTRRFYENYLLPWQKLLCEAELEGVLVDETLLHDMYYAAIRDLSCLEEEVHAFLGPCFISYRRTLEDKLREEITNKCDDYIEKRLKNRNKEAGVRERYQASLRNKIAALPTRFNLASNPQMLKILQYMEIDTNVEKRDKETNEWIEKEGTDKFVLKRAKVQGNGFADLMLRYREKETEVQYLKQYITACVEGRIYCNFSIVGTRTGRLSSSGPNLQNIKGSLRAPFVIADSGRYRIYTVDASQIEPRVIAYLSHDEELIQLFQDGRDYHNYATKLFFPKETEGIDENEIKKHFPELRNKVAKTGDLSLLYGTGPATLKTMVLVRGEQDIPLERAAAWTKDFKRGMANVLGYKKRLEQAYQNGERIKDNFGFPVVAGQSIHMTLFNTMVQGMASRMIFHASLMARRQFESEGIDAKPLVWVHDEVIWRFPKEKIDYCREVVDNYMKSYKLETPYGRVPLDVEGHIADRWQK